MNKDKRNNIKLLGTLTNADESGIIANASQIYDDVQQKAQETINSELIEAVGTGGSVDSRIAAAVNVEKTRAEGAESTLTTNLGNEVTRATNAENALNGRVDTLEDAVGTGGSVDSRIASAVATETSRAQEAEANRYTKNETYTKEEVNNLITTPNQEYVSVTATDQTTAVTDVLPAIGLADTIYRVGSWDGSQYDITKYSEYAWNGKDYVHLSTKTQIGDVFDISVYHATGGTLATYDNLEDALGTNGENIPQSLRKGGMSVKFVQTSDNKYVRYNYLLEDATTNSKFVNVANWQGVDDGLIPRSKNLVQNGAIVDFIAKLLYTKDFIVTGKYVNADGTIKSMFEFGVYTINVTNETSFITNAITYNGYIVFLDENDTVLGTAQKYVVSPNKNYLVKYDIPAGTKTIKITNYFHDGYDQYDNLGEPKPIIIIDKCLLNASYIDSKLSSLLGDITELQNDVADLQSDVDEIVLTKEGFEELAVTANILSNKFIGGDNAAIQNHDGWNMYLIPAKPATTYSIKPSKPIEINHALFILNSSKTALVGYESTAPNISQNVPAANEYGYIEITTPADAAYIACNITNFKTTNWNIFEGVGEYTPENIIKIGGIPLKSSYDDTLSERIGDIEEELSNLGTTRFANKKIVVLGDSITHLGIGRPARGWTTYFLPSLGFKTTNFKNYARSGATWSNTANTQYDITENTGSLSDDNVIYNQVNRLLADLNNNVIAAPDYIIILAGTNDAWYPNARPDATSKTADEVFSNETAWYLNSKPISECTSIAEAIRYVSEMISTNIPTAQVIVTTPLQSTAITYARNELVSGIIEGCAKYLSWNVVNQSKECSVSRIEERHANYKTDDGTHPSEIGAACIGHTLAAIMSAILRY